MESEITDVVTSGDTFRDNLRDHIDGELVARHRKFLVLLGTVACNDARPVYAGPENYRMVDAGEVY